jgi:hypothetical protein
MKEVRSEEVGSKERKKRGEEEKMKEVRSEEVGSKERKKRGEEESEEVCSKK